MPNKKAQEFACLPRVLKRAALNENPIQKITLLGILKEMRGVWV